MTDQIESKAIKPAEVYLVFNACDSISSSKQSNDMYKIYFLVLWNTGMRPSEALALKVKDVETDRIACTRLKKRHKPQEHIPIRPELYTILQGYILKYSIKGRLFPVTKWALYWAWNRIRTIIPIRKSLTLHSFRHGFALNYLRQQKEHPALALPKLQKLLGHEQLNTTGIYTKPGFDELSEDIKRMKF